MPKKAYYNLPADKRDRIAQAIIREFSQVPAARVSINRIICDARISRGSFYQYFEDKEDMVRFVLSVNRKQMLEVVDSLLAESQDVFQTMELLFDRIIDALAEDGAPGTFHNLYLSIGVGDPAMMDEREDILALARRIGQGHIDIEDEQAVQYLLAGVDILYSIFKSSMLLLCNEPHSAAEVRAGFLCKMDILKRAMTAYSDQQRENAQHG